MTLIVPYPAGGPLDTSARLIAEGASADLGKITVENKPGAGGGTGGADVKAQHMARHDEPCHQKRDPGGDDAGADQGVVVDLLPLLRPGIARGHVLRVQRDGHHQTGDEAAAKREQAA